MVFWPGPHGGLTVVHGGGNTALEIEFEMDSAAGSLTRLDGLSWIDAGFSIGAARADRRRGLPDAHGHRASSTPPARSTTPFPGCGLDSTMQLGGAGDPGRSTTPSWRSTSPMPDRVDDDRADEHHRPARRARSGCRRARSRAPPAASRSPAPAARSSTPASGLALGPRRAVHGRQRHRDADGPAGRGAAAHVRDRERRHGVLAGRADGLRLRPGLRRRRADGRRPIVVCNATPLDATKPCRGPQGTDRLAGPESPLVVYGDTSQDGVWYGGRPDDIKGCEFGPKPFDPFYKIPDDENEDDEWVFPLANPYDFDGNDIIDASGLFAVRASGLRAADRRLHRLRRRRRRPDHRQPGGRPPRRRLGRRHDPRPARRRPHLRRLRRQRQHPHARPERRRRRTPARARRSTRASPAATRRIAPVAVAQRRPLDAGRDLIYGEGAGRTRPAGSCTPSARSPAGRRRPTTT